MDFTLSDEQQQVHDMVRRFCAEEMAPLVAKAEETETFPVELFRKWGHWG